MLNMQAEKSFCPEDDFSACMFNNYFSIQSVLKIKMKIATHHSASGPRARFIFSTGKNMAAPSELISQLVILIFLK